MSKFQCIQPLHSHRQPCWRSARVRPAVAPRSTVSRQIGEKPKLTEIENPTTQARLQAGVRCRCRQPEQASYNANSLWRNGSRAFFKRPARRAQIGDIMTVHRQHHRQGQYRQRDPAQPHQQAKTPASPTSSAATNDLRQANAAIPAGPDPDRGLHGIERRQGFGQPPGSVADQRRRSGDAGAAERQSRGRRQAGDPRQLRNPRTDRRRHRAAGGHPERQHHRFQRRSHRPASPMAAAARSPTCSRPATASKPSTSCCPSKHNAPA